MVYVLFADFNIHWHDFSSEPSFETKKAIVWLESYIMYSDQSVLLKAAYAKLKRELREIEAPFLVEQLVHQYNTVTVPEMMKRFRKEKEASRVDLEATIRKIREGVVEDDPAPELKKKRRLVQDDLDDDNGIEFIGSGVSINKGTYASMDAPPSNHEDFETLEREFSEFMVQDNP